MIDCRVLHSSFSVASRMVVTTIVSTVPSGVGVYGGYAAGKRVSSHLRTPGRGGAKRARSDGGAGALNNERRASGNISPDGFEFSDDVDRYEGTGERAPPRDGWDSGLLWGEDEELWLLRAFGRGTPLAMTHLHCFHVSGDTGSACRCRVESGIVVRSGPDFHL